MILVDELYVNNIRILCDIFKRSSTSKYTIHTSDIHGSGVFAVNDITIGEVVGVALECVNENNDVLEFLRTPIGMYVNHASKGNVRLKLNGNDYYFVASRFINKNDEIVTSYDDYEKLIENTSSQLKKQISVK